MQKEISPRKVFAWTVQVEPQKLKILNFHRFDDFTENRNSVNDPILRDYFQFTGIIRDVDMESDIGPMWRENAPNGNFLPEFFRY